MLDPRGVILFCHQACATGWTAASIRGTPFRKQQHVAKIDEVLKQ